MVGFGESAKGVNLLPERLGSAVGWPGRLAVAAASDLLVSISSAGVVHGCFCVGGVFCLVWWSGGVVCCGCMNPFVGVALMWWSLSLVWRCW